MIIDILSWWYGPGLRKVWGQIWQKTLQMLESFSVDLLAKTLFAPFRQIDAGGARGSLEVQMRAWLDRTFSRFVGFFIRSFVIISGLILAVGVLIFGVLWAVVWTLVPFMPLIGFVLMVTGAGT